MLIVIAGGVVTGCAGPNEAASSAALRVGEMVERTTSPPYEAVVEHIHRSTVFASGEDGYHTFRIPALVVTPTGTLLAFAEGRVSGAGDTGNIDVVLKRSEDGGRTWGDLRVVAQDGENTVGNPVPIVDERAGRVVLLTTRNRGEDREAAIRDGTSVGTRTVWAQESDDDGRSWSHAVDITDAVKDSDWRWFATGPGHGIQIRQGPHAGRLVSGANYSTSAWPAEGGLGTSLIYSDDGGATWARGASDNGDASLEPNETAVVELPGGTLYLNARNQSPNPPSRAIAFSDDGGMRFSRPFVPLDRVVGPVVQASLWRLSSPHEEMVLLSLPHAPDARRRMGIWVSTDWAASWRRGVVYDGDFGGYSDLAELRSGSVAVLYESGRGRMYERIEIALLPPSIVTSSFIARWRFDDLPGDTIAANRGLSAFPDDGPFGFDLPVPPTPVRIVRGAAGGSAITFDGRHTELSLPDAATRSLFDIGAGESLTVDVIFRTRGHGPGATRGLLVSKGLETGRPCWWISLEQGLVSAFVGSSESGAHAVRGRTHVTDGAWHDVRLVRDGDAGAVRLYVDGRLDASAPLSARVAVENDEPLVIGGPSSSSTSRFAGEIAEVRIDREALGPPLFGDAVGSD